LTTNSSLDKWSLNVSKISDDSCHVERHKDYGKKVCEPEV